MIGAAALAQATGPPGWISAVQGVTLICAVLAFLWTMCAAVVLHGRSRIAPKPRGSWSFVGIAHVVALLLGVVTAIIQLVVLTMRIIYVTMDLVNGYPYGAAPAYGFDPAGLWSLGFLFAACTVTHISTGDRRLGTCQFWSAVAMASWACLLTPPLQSAPTGGYRRSGSTLVLLCVLSILLMLTALITGAVDRRRKRIALSVTDDAASISHAWPGLSLSAAAVAVAVILLICYHLAVPVALNIGGFRLSVLAVTGSAALAAWASLLLIRRVWSAHLADAAVALTSVGICGLATLAVPSRPQALGERYPLLFNAMMVGLAVATGLWTYLVSVWERQRECDQASGDTVRLITVARRFAFFNAAMALVMGVLMAIWPRWPTIAALDDTLGRVAAGLAANLFLLLVMLWCSRRLYKPMFQILTVLSVVSAAGFLLVRMLPFTPRFG